MLDGVVTVVALGKDIAAAVSNVTCSVLASKSYTLSAYSIMIN